MPIKNYFKKAFDCLGLERAKGSLVGRGTLLGLKNLPFKSIVDVGANEGQFAKWAAKIFPEAEIYCFEPIPDPFRKLSRWARGKGAAVQVFNLAVGDKEGTASMNLHTDYSLSSSLLKTTSTCETLYPFTKNQQGFSVKTTTLDKVFDKNSRPVKKEILLKLDVQGYEGRVIKGGKKFLEKTKACILEVCLDPLYEGQDDFKGLLLMLGDMGFYYAGNLNQSYAPNGHVVSVDSVFIK